MAVLIEATSVVIKRSAIEANFPGGWLSFAARVPNATLCADEYLARVGFMDLSDVGPYVGELEGFGIQFFAINDGR